MLLSQVEWEVGVREGGRDLGERGRDVYIAWRPATSHPWVRLESI